MTSARPHNTENMNSSCDSLIIVTLGVCLIAMLFGLAFDSGRLPWTIGLISSLPPFTVAWAAARQKCVLTPYALFAAAYGAYNGVLLIRLAFLDAAEYPYPITISPDAAVKSALLSALGSTAIVIVWLLRSDRGPLQSVSLPSATCTAAFRVGVVFLIASLAFYWLQLHQVGGYVEAIRTERVERFQMMRGTFTLPYIPFASMAISLLLAGSDGKRRLRRFTWLAMALWIGLLVLQGERSVILQYVLAGVGTLAALHPEPFRMRKVTISAIAAIVLAFLAFEQIRPLIALLMNGESTVFIQARSLDRLDPFSIVKPEKTELGGPYLSLFEAESAHHSLLLGNSYFNTLPTFLPRFLYPGQKPVDLANELADAVSGGDVYVMGWGYNPAAEAYRNFGTLGVPLVMSGWGLLFLWLGTLHGRGIWGLFLPPMLLINTVLVNRIDFRTVYLNAVFGFGTLLMAIGLIHAFSPNDHKPVTPCPEKGDMQR